MSDSIIKDSVRSFSNTFFKVIGAFLALFIIIITLITITSEMPERSTRLVSLPDHTWRTTPYNPSVPTILKISIKGVIGSVRGPSKDRIEKMLCDLVELDLKPGMLKGILLSINSPGGTVDDSDTILRLLLEFKTKMKIPVYAYVDGICASGGMMIALSADRIAASRPSLVGHVGVIMSTAFNVFQTMERLGIESKTLFAGKDKDSLNPFRPWTPTEGAAAQSNINGYYDRFVKLVAEHRPRIREESLREQGAQVYLAEEAMELGYIDQVQDSYSDMLEGIASELDVVNRYQVIELVPVYSLSEVLGSEESSLLRRGVVTHQVRLPGDLPPELANKPLYLYHPSGK